MSTLRVKFRRAERALLQDEVDRATRRVEIASGVFKRFEKTEYYTHSIAILHRAILALEAAEKELAEHKRNEGKL